MKTLEKSSVYVRDVVGLRAKLRKMYQDGANNLQVQCLTISVAVIYQHLTSPHITHTK